MSVDMTDPLENEERFNREIISQYLKYGSVDEVFKRNNWNLPISYSGFHRLIKRWGIVKTAGPNTKFSETLAFLDKLSQEKIPIERLYKDLPPSFRTSAQTLYRVVSNVKRGVVRRVGAALVITPEDDKSRVLIGKDISTPRLKFGKPYGSFSLPMGFAKKREPRQKSILRILQREVFSEHAVNKTMPDLIPANPEPFMHLLIADVAVSVYQISLPLKYTSDLSSFVLKDLRFESVEAVLYNQENTLFRLGVREIVNAHSRISLNSSFVQTPVLEVSEVNYALNPVYALAEGE